MARMTSFAGVVPVVMAVTCAGGASAQASALPTSRPEEQGVSSAGLTRLSATLRLEVAEGRYAGIVALLARNGRVVYFEALGSRDLAAGLPMETDTIVRIRSMSKLVTSAAVLMLMEEGRFNLDDPVSGYIPELSHPQVLTGGTVDAPILSPARQPITIRHLLTHTSGYIYEGDDTLGRIYARARLFESADLEELVRKTATLPLRHQPGEEFAYGISADILGCLVERVSHQPFGRFLEERIFAPLGMEDTSFDVPADKIRRLSKVYRLGPDRRLVITDEYGEAGRGMESGGGGLFSTAGDYARFAQMLLNGGSLEGRQYLSRKTVELMTANHLAGLARPRHPTRPYMGFGLGVEMRLALGGSEALGSIGQYGWSGSATTDVRIDPAEKVVAIVMAQRPPFVVGGLFTLFLNGCYAALE